MDSRLLRGGYGGVTGSLRGVPPPLSLYVGRLTPISSRFRVILRVREWAKMAPMLVPYCDFDNFKNFS